MIVGQTGVELGEDLYSELSVGPAGLRPSAQTCGRYGEEVARHRDQTRRQAI